MIPRRGMSLWKLIDSNNRMLLQLISDILDLQNLNSGTMDLKFADMNVKECVINEIDLVPCIKMPDNVGSIAPQDSPECQTIAIVCGLMQVISTLTTPSSIRAKVVSP